MTDREIRQQALLDALATRIVVLDGAMGTMLQQRHLTAQDFGGAELEGCNENLVVTRPDVVLDVHRAYFEAGADMVETDTFGGTPIVLAEYRLEDQTHKLNFEAARLARQAADEFARPGRPRFVAGSMGPTTKAITVTGGVTFPQLDEAFYRQAKGLVEGGADVLLLETCQDTRNVKAGILAIQRLRRELGSRSPADGLRHHRADGHDARRSDGGRVLGLDRAREPALDRPELRHRSGVHDRPHPHAARDGFARISCYPNAGLPNEELKYLETPESLARSSNGSSITAG